ncbi:protein translocase subunit secG [Pseudokineococcus lusitanus]|uniref:Protein-export membrane protein SecG n=1 Tax=Pseudokineococcus lusitanus TaxID=763993 RepID=A0A3N1HSC7_9ACTN|nr:preprotein translocase subunit SecG [Pseudokineococcus lusitanus]ROP45444.1 protein translocase subunit secG [Pseudokineococcus lusitanus]
MIDVLRILLLVLLGITGLFQVLLVLLHKGKGGGLSDMFGGGMSASVGSSGVAERNLNRLTVAMALLWAAVVVLLGLVERFDPSI